MLSTLKAVVRGDKIEWLDASESLFPPTQPVEALITALGEQPAAVSPRERAAGRVAALKKLAASRAFASIPDPQAWQREIREDRELPGREP